jgi:hypothetical protein
MRRVALLVSLVLASVFASSAGASPPVKMPISFEDVTATLSGVCAFDVDVSSDISGTEIDYFDASGNLTRVFLHVLEQDTFSANGKSITGEPYTFNIQILFDAEGNVIHAYASGVTSRIVLPNGTFFLSAGRLDFVNHPGEAFVLSPDFGRTGDIAAFCAALA